MLVGLARAAPVTAFQEDKLQIRLTRGRTDRVRTIVKGEQVLSSLLCCTKE